jgi:hypothetical protein
MNNRKKQYLTKKGIAPIPVTTIKRTESKLRFEYPVALDLKYQKWSSGQRDLNRQPLFSEFYKQLPKDQQREISTIFL